MPTTLTAASSFDDVAAPIGTDIRNAASVRSALQPLVNRGQFNFDRLAPVADITALKAIASPADGLVRFVGGFGIYVFDIGSAVAEALPMVVAPGAGTGRWFSQHHTIAGGDKGLAQLNASSKLLETQRVGWIVDSKSLALVSGGVTAPQDSTTNTAYTDVASGSVSFTSECNNGDVLLINASVALHVVAGSGSAGYCRVLVADGATDVPLADSEIWLGLGYSVAGLVGPNQAISTRYVLAHAGTGGTVVVKLQFKQGGGGTAFINANTTLVASLVRP